MLVYNMRQPKAFVLHRVGHFSPYNVYIPESRAEQGTDTLSILYLTEKPNGFLGFPFKLGVDWTKHALIYIIIFLHNMCIYYSFSSSPVISWSRGIWM